MSKIKIVPFEQAAEAIYDADELFFFKSLPRKN
jgi:hypothetical protein